MTTKSEVRAEYTKENYPLVWGDGYGHTVVMIDYDTNDFVIGYDSWISDSEVNRTWFKCRIYYGQRAYFRRGGRRLYLDEFIRYDHPSIEGR